MVQFLRVLGLIPLNRGIAIGATAVFLAFSFFYYLLSRSQRYA